MANALCILLVINRSDTTFVSILREETFCDPKELFHDIKKCVHPRHDSMHDCMLFCCFWAPGNGSGGPDSN